MKKLRYVFFVFFVCVCFFCDLYAGGVNKKGKKKTIKDKVGILEETATNSILHLDSLNNIVKVQDQMLLDQSETIKNLQQEVNTLKKSFDELNEKNKVGADIFDVIAVFGIEETKKISNKTQSEKNLVNMLNEEDVLVTKVDSGNDLLKKLDDSDENVFESKVSDKVIELIDFIDCNEFNKYLMNSKENKHDKAEEDKTKNKSNENIN